MITSGHGRIKFMTGFFYFAAKCSLIFSENPAMAISGSAISGCHNFSHSKL
jgi:hypothetical protein